MRGLVWFLIFLMILLVGNIILFASSEEYRFFLKKIKYAEEPVYSEDVLINDDVQDSMSSENIIWWELWNIEDTWENLTFLDTLVWAWDSQDDNLPEMTEIEKEFVQAFQTFDLKKLETHTNIFGITTEYPDAYHEWYSAGVSVYVLSTKSYTEVKNIFEALAFDLPYTLNVVNNFWTQSFFINLDAWYTDDFVRIVLEHENTAFWLKIRKDRYNESKGILDQL